MLARGACRIAAGIEDAVGLRDRAGRGTSRVRRPEDARDKRPSASVRLRANLGRWRPARHYRSRGWLFPGGGRMSEGPWPW